MINHITYEVPEQMLVWEVEFWKAIGFGRRTRPEPKPSSIWLNGGGVFIRLRPVGSGSVFNSARVAIVTRYGMEPTLDSLDRLPFRIQAEEAEPWWGARRVFVTSPSGFRVELLEHAPGASWPGAPGDD